MIAVWDNGMRYSCHEITFVDVGNGSLAKQRMIWMRKPAREGYVVCAMTLVNWFKGEPMRWEDWVTNWAEHEVTCEREYKCGPEPCTCWIAEAGLGDL